MALTRYHRTSGCPTLDMANRCCWWVSREYSSHLFIQNGDNLCSELIYLTVRQKWVLLSSNGVTLSNVVNCRSFTWRIKWYELYFTVIYWKMFLTWMVLIISRETVWTGHSLMNNVWSCSLCEIDAAFDILLTYIAAMMSLMSNARSP